MKQGMGERQKRGWGGVKRTAMDGVPSPVSITPKNSKLYLGEKERRNGMMVTKKEL